MVHQNKISLRSTSLKEGHSLKACECLKEGHSLKACECLNEGHALKACACFNNKNKSIEVGYKSWRKVSIPLAFLPEAIPWSICSSIQINQKYLWSVF